MQNTTRLYETINRFMMERAEAREEYLVMKRRYAKAAGSEYYTETMNEARKKRESRVDAAQAAARQEMAEIAQAMTEKADSIAMNPPTDEQLRILSLLKMREHVTQAELDSAAQSMDGNGAALAVLDELAHKHEILVQPYSRFATAGLTADQSKNAIRSILSSCNQIIENRTGANRAQMMAETYHAQLYGGNPDPDTFNQEPLFENEDAFYEKVSPVPLNLLSNAVD